MAQTVDAQEIRSAHFTCRTILDRSLALAGLFSQGLSALLLFCEHSHLFQSASENYKSFLWCRTIFLSAHRGQKADEDGLSILASYAAIAAFPPLELGIQTMCSGFMVSTGVYAADIHCASCNILRLVMNSVRRRENKAIVSWKILPGPSPFRGRCECVNIPECDVWLEAIEVGSGERRRGLGCVGEGNKRCNKEVGGCFGL